MIDYTQSNVHKVVIHNVGNKYQDEHLSLSKNEIELKDVLIRELLIKYFITPFKSELYYNFIHDINLSMNEVFVCVNQIFENPNSLYEQSIHLAKHLYNKSEHPNIKGGEFYVVYFKDCIINNEKTDVIGLFKSENKDTFLKVYSLEDSFEIESQQGININKLDKGCLIFNIDKENGYTIAIVDNTNKTEAHYWIDDFLQVRQRQDEYYNTQNVMSMYKTFVTKELPQQFEVTKADQAELINESVKFFKGKEEFDFEDFGNEVLKQPEVIQSFNDFSNKYQQERDIEIADNFTISDAAVKKQSRAFKSVIKLDKNFHIYVHGNNQYIKKGYDETTGMHYYQLFFKEEQ